MRTKEFLSKLEDDRIVRAIREAEATTSAEIRVYIQRGELKGDPLAAAEKKFQQLGMHKTRERNGVLIFVAPRARKFAVVGDEAIDQKSGEAFWQGVAEAMQQCFRAGQFTEGIGGAVSAVGELLARHFPRRIADGNELPDEVIEG